MRIAGIYSFNHGRDAIDGRFTDEWVEIEQAISRVDAELHKTKTSQEITTPGKRLFSPKGLNQAFREQLNPHGWNSVRVRCEYSQEHYVNDYRPKSPTGRGVPFRDMDFVKNGLSVEVQFGKYAFMVYNVCAKMTIFHKMGHIDAGVEIVPVKQFADEMSTGVSYFEQFVWGLEQRGVSNIDIPVLIVGIDA